MFWKRAVCRAFHAVAVQFRVFFMCLKMLRVDPEKLRQKLIADYSTGVIVMNGWCVWRFPPRPATGWRNCSIISIAPP